MAKRCEIITEVTAHGLANRVRKIQDEIKAVRSEDPDGIHDMRVASRRMRAALQEYAPFLDRRRKKRMQTQVCAITRWLGVPREVDVMIEMLEKERPETSGEERMALNYALRKLRARRRKIAGDCLEALRIVEAPEFETGLFVLLTSLPSSAKCCGAKRAAKALKPARGKTPCLLAHARNSLLEKHKSVVVGYRLWLESGDDEALHRLRIAFKKLRYACEVHQPHYGGEMKDFLGRLKQTQQHLGDWNDCRVLRDELTAIAEGAPPKSGQGLPGIVERFTRRAHALEAAFALAAEQFFAEPQRDAARALLKSPKDPRCRVTAFQPKAASS